MLQERLHGVCCHRKELQWSPVALLETTCIHSLKQQVYACLHQLYTSSYTARSRAQQLILRVIILQVPRTALKTPFRNGTVQDLAKQMVKLATQGLRQRRKGEETFLAPLAEIAEVTCLPACTYQVACCRDMCLSLTDAILQSGVTQAEHLLNRYQQEGSVDFIYSKEFSF